MGRSSTKRVPPSRDRILEAAEEVFSQRGFADVSLRDLISSCGCSTTAFYARFDSKDAVLEALLEEWAGGLAAVASEELPRARSLDEGFERGVDLLIDSIRDRKGLLRIFLSEASSTGSRPLVQRSYHLLAELLAARLRRSAALGGGAPHDVTNYAWGLVGALNMQLMRWAVFQEIEDDELETALRNTALSMMRGAGA